MSETDAEVPQGMKENVENEVAAEENNAEEPVVEESTQPVEPMNVN